MESSLGKNPQSNKNNSKSNLINNSEELSSIDKLFIKIRRRKKIFIITLIAFSIFGFFRTTKEKVFNSLYEGTFTLLIKDPINNNGQSSNDLSFGAAAVFEAIGGSSAKQDIPTLRKLLLSELILKDISKNFGIKYNDLVERISIDQDSKIEGILEVTLLSNNPKEDFKLLKKLSKLYVNYAILQKQKKLSDGLSFLNDQRPAIKQKNIELRSKLEDFRKQNNLIDPLKESTNKKIQIKEVETTTAELETKL